MKLDAIQAAESKLLLSTYERNPILFVRGEGVHLIDEKGDRYLDLLTGIGVNALGYSHPAIEQTIAEQSKKLIHTSNLFFHEGQAELALRLTERSGMDRAFFCNSGTEAIEAALKLSRAHAGAKRSEGKHLGTKFLALEHGFHGRTMGSVAATHKEKYREPFAPVMPDVEFVRSEGSNLRIIEPKNLGSTVVANHNSFCHRAWFSVAAAALAVASRAARRSEERV